jgi:membrane protease YdiL (CAAX protease family)
MTDYGQEYPALAFAPRRPRAAALALVLDLTLIALLVLITSVVLVGAIIALRVAQQGLDPSELAAMDAGAQLQLLGVGGLFVVLLIQNAIFIGVPLARTLLLRREPPAALGLRFTPPLRLMLLGIALGIGVLAGNLVLGAIFSALGVRQNQAEQYPLVAGDYRGQALFLLGAALIVPLGEEILFRGYLFGSLRAIGAERSWGLPAAYLISALLFGLAHSLSATEGIVALIVPTTAMGIVLAWGFHSTGSIIPGVIAHAMNNAVALLALVTCINTPGLCPVS